MWLLITYHKHTHTHTHIYIYNIMFAMLHFKPLSGNQYHKMVQYIRRLKPYLVLVKVIDLLMVIVTSEA
jgi:hypothetical protein